MYIGPTSHNIIYVFAKEMNTNEHKQHNVNITLGFEVSRI